MNDNMEKLLRRLRLKRIAVWMYEDRSVFSYIMDTYGDYIGQERVHGWKPLFRDEIDSIVGGDIRCAHSAAAQQEPAEATDEECPRKHASHIHLSKAQNFYKEEIGRARALPPTMPISLLYLITIVLLHDSIVKKCTRASPAPIRTPSPACTRYR